MSALNSQLYTDRHLSKDITLARNNIVLGNDPAFKPGGQYAPAPQYGQPNYGQPQYGQGQFQQGYQQQGHAAPQYGQPGQQYSQPQFQQGYAPQDLEAMYNRPAAGGHDTGRLTWRDALNAITATLGTIIVVGAAVMFLPTALGFALGEQGYQLGYAISMIASIVGAIGGMIAVLVNVFRKKPSAIVTMAYALFEGLFVGGISGVFEAMYPGIVFQAVLGTLAVAGSIVVLFRMGWVRTSPKLTKIFMVALGAYVLFSIANLVIVLLGGGSLRTGVLGLVIGAIAVLMASYSLVMDLELVKNAVDNGAPRNYAWAGALALAVTIVWLYVEILRILAILRGDD